MLIRDIFHIGLPLSCLFIFACNAPMQEGSISIHEGDHIILVGGNLGSRMMNYGHFETELHIRYPDSSLYIRNMCDPGDTPGFRPHPGRESPWAFPGAETFQDEYAQKSGSRGHFETPDEWITRHKADIIIGFFGFSESFAGQDGLDTYKSELEAFIKHTLTQKYSDSGTPQLALVTPTSYENRSGDMDVPAGEDENKNLEIYSQAIREVAAQHNVPVVDLFSISASWYKSADSPLTIDGSQLNDQGYRIVGQYLVDQLFGKNKGDESLRSSVHHAVQDKNWYWHNDYKIPNGVHVYGRRYEPFGPDNYPAELKKIRQMTANRDSAIWAIATGTEFDLKNADENTSPLPPVETNYVVSNKNGSTEYLYGQEALESLEVAEGYHIELFASEQEFPDLANPVQMSFDNAGRLWVSVMPSYPHYKPGDPKPNDKLLILEDTDGDHKADKQTIFADSLHLPIGFEFAPEGVYVSQGYRLILLKDNDGDDKADESTILMEGFDDHDTHHAISAFVTDPSGAIYMGEGVFLHTNVETSYGTVRATNGGFYRYQPQRHHLERTAQLAIPNPWGIAFDEWGQHFFAETSGPDVRWMLPGSVKPRYGIATHKSQNLIEDAHRVRPTSGLEFVSSRHFPEDIQDNLMINNTIGFLGMKVHTMDDDGTGYSSRHTIDLVKGNDKNFRPVDMEFAPDGSLYFIDWHNILIGHMQHNARDPYRDHVHGRVYRVTYPSRPLVEPAKIVEATIPELLDNLKLPEYRSRYRTRRELRGRDSDAVVEALSQWVSDLDQSDERYEHHLLEALWVTWGLNRIDETLLRQLLQAKDHRARAATVRVLNYTGHQIQGQGDYLLQAAQDPHGRVRLEAIIAASKLPADLGTAVVKKAGEMPMDEWIVHAQETALAHLDGRSVNTPPKEKVRTHLVDAEHRRLYFLGKELYEREGYCMTCHQQDGKGLKTSDFPPLVDTDWVLGDKDRLIKVILNGMMGPIEIDGHLYPGNVPMTPFGGLMNDEEVAAVSTYVRNAFGNRATPVLPKEVEKVREETADRKKFYTAEELLEM